jgi:hypothetical protein
MRLLCQKILNYHWTTTFLLMGLFSFLGAVASYDLFTMLAANFRFAAYPFESGSAIFSDLRGLIAGRN